MEIKIKCGIILIISFLLICETVSALTADQINISSSGWVVAGSTDTAVITVQLTGITGNSSVRIWCMDPLMGKITANGEQITFNQTAYAIFSAGTKSGDATIVANVTTEGGDTGGNIGYQKVDHSIPKYFESFDYSPEVPIGNSTLISVSFIDVYGNPIDTQRPQTEYNESVDLLASPEGDGGFFDGDMYLDMITLPYNGSWNISYRVPTLVGSNVIQVIAPSSVLDNIHWITIRGTPGTPDHITSTISSTSVPNASATHEAIANGKEMFFIYYTVYDRYNNPVPGIKVNWEIISLAGREIRTFTTNYQGQIYLEHGPSTIIQNLSVTATLAENSSISCYDDLAYISGSPALFVLYANREILASRDMDENSNSVIRARLMDSLGRPIAGKNVHFILQPYSVNGSALVSNASLDKDKDWLEIDYTTDDSGYAFATFYPGAFPRFNETGWDPDSYGVAIITASSEDLGSRALSLTYKNYPFLRVETELQPPQIAVNDTVNITIRLIGDGFVQYRPIDVMLCNNRGEAMLQDMFWEGDKGRKEDKMVYLYEATKNFTFNVGDGSNYVGLVSFGINGSVDIPHENTTYGLPGDDNTASDNAIYTDAHYAHPKSFSAYATVDSNLTTNMSAIVDILNQTSPSKDPHGTVLVPMRPGLYKSIRTLNDSGHKGYVKGVVLLTDSEWTAYGDPTAGWDGTAVASSQGYYESERDPVELSQGGLGLWTAFDNWSKTDLRQDMAHYANENEVHIYSIAYFKKGTIVPTSLDRVLKYLAESTGGKYYTADSAKALDQVYVAIAEDLKKYASVDTSMNLSFEQMNMTYDNLTQSFPGTELFSYEYEERVSTNVTSWNKTVNPLPGNLVVPPYPADAIPKPHNDKGNKVINYPYSLNQTAQWNSGKLTFYAGNIILGQTWQAQFRLKALKPGFIDLFGPNSAICYTSENKPGTCIHMPSTYLTVTQNQTRVTLPNALDIINGSIALDSEISDVPFVSWVLNYTGSSTAAQIASYQYSRDGVVWENNWHTFGNIQSELGPIDHRTYGTTLDRRDQTGCLKIKIFAYEEVTPAGASDEEISSVFCMNRNPGILIT